MSMYDVMALILGDSEQDKLGRSENWIYMYLKYDLIALVGIVIKLSHIEHWIDE